MIVALASSANDYDMLIFFDTNRQIKGTAGKLETPLLLWHFSSKTRNTGTTKQISREKMRETGLERF